MSNIGGDNLNSYMTAGQLEIQAMHPGLEGEYSCRVQLGGGAGGGAERVLRTRVEIMPDIVLTQSRNIDIEEVNHNITTSAANRLIGEVAQSRRRPLLGPSPG